MSDLKIFTGNIEPEALRQIHTLIKQPAFSDCKVRIMPDVHAGAGCVIGFTADLGDKVIPNIVGVDIGCGMLTTELGKIDINFQELDDVIRKYVPSGRNVHNEEQLAFSANIIEKLCCKEQLRNVEWLKRSLGTLGGGNHFIEIDIDNDRNNYLVIHSGSRNLGKQVADIYQKMAIDDLNNKPKKEEIKRIIEEHKRNGKEKEISSAIAELNKKDEILKVPKELSYLMGEHREMYLHDMKLCQRFAIENRKMMTDIIICKMGWRIVNQFETIHNYIEDGTNMVRKGAISSKSGERVLIPINMRDGCIIGIGKGNDDWNYSAPHGAGRIMSRSKAKEKVSMDEYEKSMQGIFTTSVNKYTIDESPMAYKPMDEILENIKDTVEVERIIKPIYNFKASD